MAISKDKKQKLVAELTELLSDSKMVVYAKYEGLSVAELQELRRAAREAGVKIKVVKNRLVKVAMKEIAAYKDTDVSGLTGQLLYSLGSDEDFDAAKVLAKFAKTHPKVELIGGFNAEGESLPREEVVQLGSLPTKNELIAQVVDTLLSGINGVVSALENKPEKVEAKAEAAEASEADDKAEADKSAEADEADAGEAADESKEGEAAEATESTDEKAAEEKPADEAETATE